MSEVLEVVQAGWILGIETSCDDTAVAVLHDGEIVSSVVRSQTALHAPFGGVVPELAARSHDGEIADVIDEALVTAGRALDSFDAIAVTNGPGLPGSLMVGVATAQGLALASGVALIAVDHMEGHLFAAALEAPVELPAVVLLVSGGHTQIIRVNAPGRYELLGETIDDAAGEAFDKVARLLDLGYPGGPAIERCAVSGDPMSIPFPRGLLHDGLDFSFSGLKTSVRTYLGAHHDAGVGDVAASFQEAVVDVLVRKLERAIDVDVRSIVVGGGVAANASLRQRVSTLGRTKGLAAVLPALGLCTDNAAMIAAAGGFHLAKGEPGLRACDILPGRRLVL
ncbi:MAG: tRNA (adenosine(37)-N6)-threonylcarbamoyltransferase complex transferase subunit TsaD [Ferrimicrobium sp.]